MIRKAFLSNIFFLINMMKKFQTSVFSRYDASITTQLLRYTYLHLCTDLKKLLSFEYIKESLGLILSIFVISAFIMTWIIVINMVEIFI